MYIYRACVMVTPVVPNLLLYHNSLLLIPVLKSSPMTYMLKLPRLKRAYMSPPLREQTWPGPLFYRLFPDLPLCRHGMRFASVLHEKAISPWGSPSSPVAKEGKWRGSESLSVAETALCTALLTVCSHFLCSFRESCVFRTVSL